MLSLLAHPLYIDRTDRWSGPTTRPAFAKATQGKISVFLIMGLKVFGRIGSDFLLLLFFWKNIKCYAFSKCIIFSPENLKKS